jgi:hypothetical protein
VPPCVPIAPDPLPVLESSSNATCPGAPGMRPTRRGLRCHHVSHGSNPTSWYGGLWRHHVPRGTGLATRQGRFSESPCVSWLQTRPLAREGSGIATCLRNQDHRPTWALVSPRVPWLQTLLPVQEGSGATKCPVAFSL